MWKHLSEWADAIFVVAYFVMALVSLWFATVGVVLTIWSFYHVK